MEYHKLDSNLQHDPNASNQARNLQGGASAGASLEARAYIAWWERELPMRAGARFKPHAIGGR